MRERMTSAHVISVIALVFAIGGGTAVALKGKNTVNSGDIKNNNVKSTDVRDNSLTGADVNESTLNIPSETSTCPSGAPNRSGDLCYSAAKPEAQQAAAITGCYGEGLRLPDIGEAGVALKALADGTQLWTGEVEGAGNGVVAQRVDANTLQLAISTNVSLRPYVCVATPTVN